VTAQEFVNALVNEREQLNGQRVSAHGREYILKIDDPSSYGDGPDDWWDVELADLPGQPAAKLRQKLTDLERDPVDYLFVEKHADLVRQLRAAERKEEEAK